MTKAGSTEKVVRAIRRHTRRRFSAQEKIRIVLEGLRGEEGVPHPVPWTHICAMPPGVAHTPRAPRSAFDTQASREALVHNPSAATRQL